MSWKTLHKQDITKQNGKYNRKYLQIIDIIVKKNLYCLAKNLRLRDESPMLFYKKTLYAGVTYMQNFHDKVCHWQKRSKQ